MSCSRSLSPSLSISMSISLSLPLTLSNLNSPFLEGCGGQWEDSCFVSLHWLIYISTASLSKWPLSVLTYENYRGHWGPYSFNRPASTQHSRAHTRTPAQTCKNTQTTQTDTHKIHPLLFCFFHFYTQTHTQKPSSLLCSSFFTSRECRKEG